MRTLFLLSLAALSGSVLAGAGQPPAVPQAPAVTAPPATPRVQAPAAPPAAALTGFDRWEKEIAAYEASDRTNPPPKGGIVFIGSSTIRRWETLAADFPDHKVINRGFGGSEIADATHFADRIIFPYAPKQVFLRAGGNDIHAGLLPNAVARNFADFVRVVHGRLPLAEIVYIGVNPAPSRWGENDKLSALNAQIRAMALNSPRVCYVDCYDISVTRDGQPRPELFVADRLHFNADGYKLLADKVRPYLTATK
jgi:lysophospholipase L1-like esterase